MKSDNINEITAEEINNFSEICSIYFITLRFKQIYLNSSIDYYINNTKYISLPNNKYLRCNTEPDIWEKSRGSNTFFAITSLFRLENINSLLHKQEFKIVDFYLANSNFNSIISHIFNLLKIYEKNYNLYALSELKREYIDYEKFIDNNYDKSIPQICIVNNYPIEETFYDDVAINGIPLKSELFFTFKEINIEFAVLGKVGKNLNPINFIDNYKFHLNNSKLWGGGIGIERVLLVYKALNSML